MKYNLIVIDASIAVKPFFKEEGFDLVNRLFAIKDSFKLSVIVPDFFKYEFFNVVMRKKNNLQGAEVSFQLLTEKQFSQIPFENDLVTIALRLMEQYSKISFYDASYHALAKAYNTDFITADERYYQITKKEGNVKLLKHLKI